MIPMRQTADVLALADRLAHDELAPAVLPRPLCTLLDQVAAYAPTFQAALDAYLAVETPATRFDWVAASTQAQALAIQLWTGYHAWRRAQPAAGFCPNCHYLSAGGALCAECVALDPTNPEEPDA